jgi:protein-disulfide isomerase
MLARRPFIATALLAALALGGCGKPPLDPAAVAQSDDMTLGNPNAKIHVIEYASASCPHCARFAIDVFPTFRAKYIDTGKVNYTLKEYLTEPQAIAAAGFLLARCAGKDKYFQIVDAVFRQEAELLESDRNAEKRDRLVKIAQSAGIPETQFDACTSNDDSLKAFNDRVEASAKQYNVESTPTFVINGKSTVGYQDMTMIDKSIADAQAAAK